MLENEFCDRVGSDQELIYQCTGVGGQAILMPVLDEFSFVYMSSEPDVSRYLENKGKYQQMREAAMKAWKVVLSSEITVLMACSVVLLMILMGPLTGGCRDRKDAVKLKKRMETSLFDQEFLKMCLALSDSSSKSI